MRRFEFIIIILGLQSKIKTVNTVTSISVQCGLLKVCAAERHIVCLLLLFVFDLSIVRQLC